MIPADYFLYFGQNETLTAVVTNIENTGVPAGTVTFDTVRTNSQGVQMLTPLPQGPLTLVPPSAGQGSGLANFATATISTTTLPDGPTAIEAVYTPATNSGDLSSTSAPVTVTVDQATTTVVSVSSSSSSSSIFTAGQPVTFTATISAQNPGSGMPTGTATFEDAGAVIGTAPLVPISGESTEAAATLTTSSLPLGPQSVTAVYSGDSVNQGSTSAAVDLAVGSLTQNATATALAATSGPLSAFQSATLIANVGISVAGPSTGNDAPTGTITFLDGATPLLSLGSALSGGVTASFTTPLNLNGLTILDTQTLDTAAGGTAATFSTVPGGSTTAGSSTVSTASGVTTAAFTTTLGSSTVTGTLTLSITSGVATAECSVTLDDSTITESSTLTTSSGVLSAKLTTTTLAAGAHAISAIYSGDPDNLASAAPPLILQVLKATSGMQVADTSPVAGQPLVATISAPGTPTGTVTFEEITTKPNGTPQSTVLGTAPVSDDTASLNIASLVVGNSYTIDAQYSGDANDLPSGSGDVTIGISQSPTTVSVTSSPASGVGDQTEVTLTATVTVQSPGSGIPTGSITFSDEDNTINSTVELAPSSGVATAVLDNVTLPVGFDPITATYSGDSDDLGNSGSITVFGDTTATGGSVKTQTSLGALSPVAYGQPVTLTATVSGGTDPDPHGGVDFFEGAIPLGTGNLGEPNQSGITTATLAAPLSSAGVNMITAVYTGDGTNDPSLSAASTITVAQAPTEIAVQANPGYSTQDDVFSATVTEQNSGQGAIGGTVTLYASPYGSGVSSTPTEIAAANVDYDGPNEPGPGGGLATADLETVTTLPAGLYTITAVYSGDHNNLKSTSTFVFPVGTTAQNATQAVLSPPSVASPVFGQRETLTETVNIVAQNDPAVVTPTGTVTFFDGSTGLGTSALTVASGVATAELTTTALPAGSSNAISAVYHGDASDIPSVSSPMSLTVSQTATSTAVTASPGAPVVGQPVTLTATVTEADVGEGVLTGNVTFFDGKTALGSSAVTGSDGVGRAVLVTTSLALGDHSVTAVYNGDANNTASEPSGAVNVSISRDVTQVVVLSPASSAVYGQPLTITAIVSVVGPGAGMPTDQVKFIGNGTETLGTGTIRVSGGVNTAAFATAGVPVGTYSIAAEYLGDANDAPSTSTSSIPLTINPAPLMITATAQQKAYGQTLSTGIGSTQFTSTGLKNGETIGSVTLSVGSSGGAATAPFGSYAITPSAATGGTFTPGNYQITYATGMLNVTPALLTITADNASKVVGQPNPAFSVEYSGFVLGQGPSVLSGALSISSAATSSSPIGSYAIIPAGLTSSNYAITYQDGTLVIGPPLVTVTSLNWETVKLSRKKSVKELVVTFSAALDPADAIDPAAYTLDSSVRKKKLTVYTKPVPMAPPSYNPATHTVALALKGKPPAKEMQLSIIGADLLDTFGRGLDGKGDGQPGSNLVALLNDSRVISLARTTDEASAARITAAAVDAVMADGFPSSDLVAYHRRTHHDD